MNERTDGWKNEDAETYELLINKGMFVDHPDMCALVVLMNDVSKFIDIPTTRTITKTLAPTTSILTSSESTYWSTSDGTDSLGIFNITPIPRLRKITRSDVSCNLSSNSSLIGFRKA